MSPFIRFSYTSNTTKNEIKPKEKLNPRKEKRGIVRREPFGAIFFNGVQAFDWELV